MLRVTPVRWEISRASAMQRRPLCRRCSPSLLRRVVSPKIPFVTTSRKLFHSGASPASEGAERQHPVDLQRKATDAAVAAALTLTFPLSSTPSSSTAAASAAESALDAVDASPPEDSFNYLYREVNTTIDVAPVRRPRLAGSLQCTLGSNNISFLLVEACEGTTNEEVTRRVQRQAVLFARRVQSCTGLPVDRFLRREVCERWPAAMKLLSSTDLSLQLHVALAADDKPAATTTTVRCAAALYDPWGTEPRPTPLRLRDRRHESGRETVVSLHGELTAVLASVMIDVKNELVRRCTAMSHESASEVARFVNEAGNEPSQRWLTSQLHSASVAGAAALLGDSVDSAVLARCPALQRRRATSSTANFSYALSYGVWRDTAQRATVALQVGLELVAEWPSAPDTPVARHCFASASANRGIAPLAVAAHWSGAETCVVTNNRAVADPPASQPPLTMAELAASAESGSLVLTSSMSFTPLTACSGDLLSWAAVVSPAIAHDWLGGERCGMETRAAGRRRSGSLPSAVRWSSFAGRRALDAFLHAAAQCDADDNGDSGGDGAAKGHALPPLWPRVTSPQQTTDMWAVQALRELVASEEGLRNMRRTQLSVTTATGSTIRLEYDVDVTTGYAPAESVSPPPIAATPMVGVCVWSEWYADVSAAAQVHTPWALPLFATTTAHFSPNSIVAVPDAAGPESKTKYRATMSGDFLSVTGSLRSCGIVRATWDAAAAALVCYGADASVPSLRFAKLDTVDGVVELLRFCGEAPQYNTATLKLRGVRRSLSSLLSMIMTEQVSTTTACVDNTKTCVALFRLPFDAGEVQLLASTPRAVRSDSHRLLLHIQSWVSKPSQLRDLETALAGGDTTFLNRWPVMRPWLHPYGPLRVTARSTGSGGASASFTMEIACRVPASNTTSRVAAALPGEEEGSWSTRRRVAVPLAGVAWVRDVYAAVRDVLLSLPADARRTANNASSALSSSAGGQETEGDISGLVLRCRDYSELCHALLCRHVTAASSHNVLNLGELLCSAIGGSVEHTECGEGCELHLQVAPCMRVVLAAVASKTDVAAEPKEVHSSWKSTMEFCFLQSAVPDVALAAEALWMLQRRLRALSDKGTFGEQSPTVRMRWASEAAATASPDAAPFCVDVALRRQEALSSRWSAAAGLAACVVPDAAGDRDILFSASGNSLVKVLTHIRIAYAESQLSPTLTLKTAGTPRGGFLAAAHAHLAKRHALRRVTVRYDEAAGRLCVLGWRATGTDPEGERPTCLAEERVPSHAVPAAVFRLHRRLLDDAPEMCPTELPCTQRWSRRLLLLKFLATELGHPPLTLPTTFALERNVWTASVTLPLEMLRLECDTVGPGGGFCVTAAASVKKVSLRMIFDAIYSWLCGGPSSSDPPGSVQGSVTCSLVRDDAKVKKAALVQRPSKARPPHLLPLRVPAAPPHRPTVSLVDRLHTEVVHRLAAVMDCAEGRVVLQLSQTFGLELTFEAASPAARGDMAKGCSAVQLLRAAWQRDVWAPAQILTAEATVLARLVRGAGLPAGAEDAARFRAALVALDQRAVQHQLRCGAAVPRRDFCISFFRRYFGWRVCEEDDLADLPVSDAVDSVVVYEAVDTTAPSRGRDVRLPRVSLRLGQITSPGKSGVRLAQVLVTAADADVTVARAGLWDTCAQRVRDVFGVTRLMTVEKVDAAMLRYLADSQIPPDGPRIAREIRGGDAGR